MNEDKKAFLKVVKEFEVAKESLAKLSEELQLTLAKLPLNGYLQDPETLLVYKVVSPKGRFVYYTPLDYERTKKPDERSGNLSMKEVTAAGFQLA